jgi:glycosyltransferase involved in cell wall biosynthesis
VAGICAWLQDELAATVDAAVGFGTKLMKPPKVSICIPTYNGREHLKECLDSVRAQSFQDFEVVICDDQSSDGTLDLARELAQGDERFRFLPNPRRFGLVANWNHCIAVSRGEWIKFVFQDDLIAPTCVEKLLRACELTGKPFSFCARDIVFEDGTSESLRKWFLSHQATLDSRYLNRCAIEAAEAGRMALQDPGFNAAGEPTVTLIRKSVFEGTELFDGALIQLCDAELWFRIMSNLGAAWVPDRLATFRVHAKAATAAHLRRRMFRVQFLDRLIVLYRFAFDRHYSRLRSTSLTGKSTFTLRKECAVAAYHARRDARRQEAPAEDPAHSFLGEWHTVASSYPRLEWLARIGWAVAGCRRAKRAAAGLLRAADVEGASEGVKFHAPPVLSPVPENGRPRPFWSVMIPTYRQNEKYLRQTLESVLQQDPGPEMMQIEVVDDGSPDVDAEPMVKSLAGDRIGFSRNPKNLGLTGCWNACIQRSRGQWVHILHSDDYVLPGFYERLARAAQLHPEVSLLASRSFFVDAECVIFGVTDRLRRLENGGCEVDDFFYATPIQCPGVVVKRSFYQTLGGFRSDLTHTMDCEMWARVISTSGGLVTPEVLSCFRISGQSETALLKRTAETAHDIERLNQIFARRHPGFDCKKARRRVCYSALDLAERFARMGDSEAAKANLDYWRRNAPLPLRLRRFAVKIARRVFP